MDDDILIIGYRVINQAFEVVQYTIIPTIMFLLLFAAVLDMRKKYPHEIYAIWYIFFLFFLIFLALYLYAESEHQQITEILGPSYVGTLKAIQKTLTTVEDELLLVGAIVYLGIAPQLLTYVISGLSGAATAPIYIRQIGLVAVWSIIKFLAGLGGILLAQPAAKWWLKQPVPIGEVDSGLAAIAIAFALAAMQHKFFDNAFEVNLMPGLRMGFQVPFLMKIHEYFTRHRPPPAKSVTIDRAKDAAILAATAAGTVAVAVMRDPAADIATIASRVVKGVAAIEEETRAEAEAAREAAVAAKAAQLVAREEEWKIPAVLFSLHFRGAIVTWVNKRRKKRKGGTASGGTLKVS
jgi:hypothetical protein